MFALSDVKKLGGVPLSWTEELTFPPVKVGQDTVGFAGPVKAELTAQANGARVVVRGRVQAVVEVCCHRCLEPFHLKLAAPYLEEFRPQATASAAGGEEEGVHLVNSDAVDLGETVLAALLLEMPMQFTCQPECRGLCPKCGQNLNQGLCQCPVGEIDPRLAVLQDFFRESNRKPRKEG